MRDLMQELAAVDRSTGEGQVPAGGAKVVTLTRRYDAEVAEVWDALTDPQRLARWFLPVTGDLHLGGRFAFVGNAGGVVRECEPPHRVLVTWEMGEATGPDASLVHVRLSAEGAGTLLELEHRAQFPPEMWDTYGPGAVGVGWDGGLLGLALHLAGEYLEGSQDEIAADPAVREFNRAAAQAWGRAHEEAGTAPGVVAAATAATTEFYVPAQP